MPKRFKHPLQPTRLMKSLAKPSTIELSFKLFPKITSSKDVNINDAVIPADEGLAQATNGAPWIVIRIGADRLLIQQERLLETCAFYVNFSDVRLNPYRCFW